MVTSDTSDGIPPGEPDIRYAFWFRPWVWKGAYQNVRPKGAEGFHTGQGLLPGEVCI